MSNPHPQALRIRAVEAYLNGEGTQKQIAKRFKVSLQSINDWVKLYRQNGNVDPRPSQGGVPSEITREALEAILKERNDLTYEEMAQKLQEQGIDCARSSVFRAIQRFGLTRKKKSLYDPRREEYETERKRFLKKIAKIPSRRIVVLDEAGVWSHMTRTHGYGPKGERVVSPSPAHPEIRQTVLAGISISGILAPLIVDGAMNGSIFVAWLEQELFPLMKRGDVLVLDNLGAHHVEEVAPCARKFGIKLMYLPPYSPDLSPIEMMWSKVKAFMRKIGAVTQEEIEKAFCTALDAVSLLDISNWFQHCNYDSSIK